MTVLAAAAGWFFAMSVDPTYSARGVVEPTDDLSGTAQRQVAFEDLEAQRQILLSNTIRAGLDALLGDSARSLESIAGSTDEDSTQLTINTTASSEIVAVTAANHLIDLYEARRVVDQRADFISRRDDTMSKVIEQAEEVESAANEPEFRAFTLRQQNAVPHLQNLEAQLQEVDSEVTLADGRVNVIDRPVDASVSEKNPIQFAVVSGVLGLILSVTAVTTTLAETPLCRSSTNSTKSPPASTCSPQCPSSARSSAT
ncbi:MAG: hypothetical protein ACI8Y4_000307 [Candidatus Poriferisodalaceae bacterium]